MKPTVRQKILNILVSLLLVIYPVTFGASVAYADISLPGAPNTPDSPDAPGLPGKESGTSSGASSKSSWYSGATSENSNTGSNSTNNADTTIDNDTDIDIDNDANIDNIVEADSITGRNDANNNTGDGTINTGNAGISGYLATNANNVSIGALECVTSCGVVDIGSLESSNSNTGSGSTNDSTTTQTNDNSTNIDNDANIVTYANFDADSGNNSTSDNTGNGTITTGDADIILTAINTANNINVGYEVFNVYDDQTGDLVIDYNSIPVSYVGGSASSTNTNTGSDSENNASTTTNNTNTLIIDQDGNIINTYDLDANTGYNTADRNTGNGTITTGDANVVFNLVNFLNNALLGGGELLLGVVNIFGTFSGDIVLTGLSGGSGSPYYGTVAATNTSTGSDSTNNASVSQDNDTTINLGNDAQILNNIYLDANTGGNDTSDNTGSGSIVTGDSDVGLKVTNIANTSTIGDGGTIWMVLVNNLGTWTGQLFNTAAGTGGAYSPFFTFTINPDGTISAANTTTGSGSENNASTTLDNDTDISITNTASVTNNIMVDANTGGNSASKNTGSGTITTGNANIAANVVNMINNIFLGGRVVITIVNIFGSFFGDIREGSGAPIVVPEGSSVAITPGNVSSGTNHLAANYLGGAAPQSNGGSEDNDDQNTLVLGTNKGGGAGVASIARFGADPGIFDGFRLEYLLLPITFGLIVAIFRRVLQRR